MKRWHAGLNALLARLTFLVPLTFSCGASPSALCAREGNLWIDARCWPDLPTQTCAPGTAPRLGEGCSPVGTGTCAPGFAPDVDGWGCVPIFAPECAPGTRPVLGETTCRRIDDCQRPFPPADATIFVDDDYGPAKLDATHFASLTQAVAAAPSGAHLAIDSGVYEGLLILDHPLTLEGRCVAGTLIGDLNAGWSVVVEAGVRAAISHLSFGQYAGGIQVRAGGRLDASHLYLEQVGPEALAAFGADAVLQARVVVIRDLLPVSGSQSDGIPALARDGGTVALTEALIDGYYQGAGVSLGQGSRVVFERVIARRGSPGAANSAFAMLADTGGRIEARSSAFLHNGRNGFHLRDPGTLLLGEDITIIDTAGEASGGAHGRALDVGDGAEAQVTGFTFRGSGDAVVLVRQAKAALSAGVLRGVTSSDGVNNLNTGAAVIEGAELSLFEIAVLDTTGDALVAATGAPKLFVRSTFISRVHGNRAGNQGVGLAVFDGARATVSGVTILQARWAGVQINGPGSFLDATGLAVVETRAPQSGQDATRPGLGMVVENGAALVLQESLLRGSEGIAIVVGGRDDPPDRGTAAGLETTRIEQNLIGANTQGGVEVGLVASLPGALESNRLLLADSVLFRDNTTRVAAQVISLPAPPPAFSP